MSADLDPKSMMLGDHNARLSALETKTQEIDVKLDRVLEILNTTRGSWKTLVTLGGVIGAVIEAAHTLKDFVHFGGPH